jgi:hypothetical protein
MASPPTDTSQQSRSVPAIYNPYTMPKKVAASKLPSATNQPPVPPTSSTLKAPPNSTAPPASTSTRRTFGLATSTTRVEEAALKHFDAFQLANKRQPGIQNLQDRDVEGQLLIDLCYGVAEYLSTVRLPSGKIIASGSALQYLSSIKECLFARFSHHPMWQNEMWYSKLRTSTETATLRNAMNEDPDANQYSKTLPLYIESHEKDHRQEIRNAVMDRGSHSKGDAYAIDLKSLCDRQLHRCKAFPDENHGPAQQRLWYVLLLHAIGRGGEVALQQYKEWHWDVYFCAIDAIWKERKTLTRHAMLFGPWKYSEDGFLCDILHALGTFFIVEGGLDRDTNSSDALHYYIFPQLQNTKTDCCTIVSNSIKKHVHPDLKDFYSTRSIRKGVTTAVNGVVPDANVEYSGGWNNGSNSKAYKENNLSQSLPVLNYITGWKTLYTKKVSPQLQCLGPQAVAHLDKFQDALYDNIGVDLFRPEGRLRPLLEACTASQLMYFADVKRRYGSEHLLVKYIVDAANRAKISHGSITDPVKVLYAWGKAIKERFLADNVDCPQLDATAYNEQVAWQNEFNRKMAADTADLKEMIREHTRVHEAKVDALLELIREQAATIAQCTPMAAAAASLDGASVEADLAATSCNGKLAARVSLSPNGNASIAMASGTASGIVQAVAASGSKRAADTAMGALMKKMRENSKTAEQAQGNKVTLANLITTVYRTEGFVGQKSSLKGKLLSDFGKIPMQKGCFALAAAVVTDAQWELLCTPNLGRRELAQVTEAVQARCLARMLQLETNGARTESSHKGNFDGLGSRVKKYRADHGEAFLSTD